MAQDRRRPTERGRTTVSAERPQHPSSRPRDARPRTGNASAREAARRERLSREAPSYREAEPEQTPRPRPKSAPKQAAPQQKRKKARKPHRVYNTNFGLKFLVMLAVVAVIVLSMIIFFKVKHIEVLPPEGQGGATAYYSAEEIIAASGINLDENLLSLSKATVAARIHAALPYVNDIQIKKQLPGTVVISFTEFDVSYAIQDEAGGWWLMSREGRILDATDEKEAKNHLYVTGMPIQVPQVGDYIQAASTEGADLSEIAAKQTVVKEIIPALEGTDFVKQLDRIDVSTSYDLTLWWTADRYQIRLGTTENLSYKLQFLQATLENTEVQHRSGIIDLTFQEDEKVHFLEFR
jgi:cell division septal protein FtsQ